MPQEMPGIMWERMDINLFLNLFTLFHLAFLVPFRYEWHFDGISLFSVTRLRGKEHDTSLKIETARQAATSSNSHALTIAPCPSLSKMFKILFCLLLFTLVVDQLIKPIGD